MNGFDDALTNDTTLNAKPAAEHAYLPRPLLMEGLVPKNTSCEFMKSLWVSMGVSMEMPPLHRSRITWCKYA